MSADEHDEREYAVEDLGFGERTGRTGRAVDRTRRPARAARRLVVLVVTIGLIGAAAVLALTVLRPMLSGLGDNDYPGPGSGSVTFTVNEGDSGRSIGANLEKAGVVKTAKAFVDAYSDEPKAASIQPGEYLLRTQMKASDALTVLVDPKNRQVARVTVREGLWASETYALLSKATGKPVADYEAAAKDAAALGLPTSAQGNIEGYLFPATYEFSAKNSAAEQLRTMVGKAVAELAKQGVTGDKAQRVMILASIIEAEGRREADRPKIARVILNRLAKPMRLQLDSTVAFATRTRTITTTDAQRATASPWNTYQVDGLPAGPIANPGASAITAALHPADGPWLYFVAVNPSTGETKFATTQAEHDRNVAEFQAWCAANKGQC